MFGRSKTQAVKESAASGTDLAVSLAKDKKFRKQLLSAVGHGAAARQRAASRIGLVAAVHRLGTDKELRTILHGKRRARGATRRHGPALGRQGRKQETAEWDAKILEQHPDKQISWISEDRKKTRGTVSFEPIGESRTRMSLSMSYQAEGLTEALGSAVGLDERRVRGDLHRFKELVESRSAEWCLARRGFGGDD